MCVLDAFGACCDVALVWYLGRDMDMTSWGQRVGKAEWSNWSIMI